MKTTKFTSLRNTDTEQFDYILEISAWADTGTTEYIGITGGPTRDELFDLLSGEVDRIHAWMDEEAKKGNMEARTDEPQVAVIRQRPEADEDGDFAPLDEWPVIIDWN